jgi:hypothetical protein
VIVEARQAEISFGPDMPTKRRSNVPFWTKHGGDGTRLKRSESFLYVRPIPACSAEASVGSRRKA